MKMKQPNNNERMKWKMRMSKVMYTCFSICFQMLLHSEVENIMNTKTTNSEAGNKTDKNQQTTSTTEDIINRHVIHAKTNRAQLGREHHEYNHGMRRKHNRRMKHTMINWSSWRLYNSMR